ncbi:DeoR family transcriptional regulator (plasmid) [Streptomyces alboflavus]|uniref:DeoR family transcriptional regulator n=1 Tax=Streptomyces alboflavus TaxID=67267 RepID=A0A291W4S0_9ACTN|nr:DeoR family transcriptional regulator [Streptomyces alboflavus]
MILDAAGRTVGEGYHLRKGDAHAEVNALTAAGEYAIGGTAVVTLEPCNHHGVTPACHQALLDAKVARVLIAVMDPTSRGEGGASRLRKAGLDVETHVLEEEALAVLGPWQASLSNQRATLHLLVQTDGTGLPIAPTQAAHTEIERQRDVHDLVVLPDGSVEEGRAGSHGSAFQAPDHPVADEPAHALAMFTDAGARTVLLVGPSTLSQLLLSTATADRLTLIHPIPEPSQLASAAPASALIPDRYTLSGICRVGDHLIISVERR